MAAAVADYRPSEAQVDKRSKDAEGWTVELEPTEDVLAELGRRRANGQLLVGFAADHGAAGLERARAKLVAKAVDLVVFNDVSRADIGFDAPDNEVVMVLADAASVWSRRHRSQPSPPPSSTRSSACST